METIPSEVRLQEFWKNLSYEEIVNLCRTNVEFSNICQSNVMWQYLLYRDFDITYTRENARSLYLLYKHTVDHFSQFYPIITQKALQKLIELIPVSEWNKFDKAIRERQEYQDAYGEDKSLVLTGLELFRIVYVEDETVNEYVIEERFYRDQMEELFQNMDLIHPGFSQMIKQLEQNNCVQFKSFIYKPSLIFIKTKPIIINYDYELAVDLNNDIGFSMHRPCDQQIKQIYEEIVGLLR
jgi:hypothetical protein